MAGGTKSPKRGLGRGLEALLGGSSQQTTLLYQLPIDQVTSNVLQPRRTFSEESLNSLAESIEHQGLLQPINVRKLGLERYEIISGERRWRAAQRAGLTHIPAQVLPMSESQSFAAALVENIQREDLNPLEEARALQRLIEEFELTHEALAHSVGRSRVSITNALRLLKLSPEVLNMLAEGHIEMGHARALLGAPSAQQLKLAEKIRKNQLSVRHIEQLVSSQKTRQGASSTATSKNTKQDPDTLRLAMKLSDQLGTEVRIRPSARGKDGRNGRSGRLTILYQNNEHLDGIIKRLQRPPPKSPPEGAH